MEGFLIVLVLFYGKTQREQVLKSLFRWEMVPNMAFGDRGKFRYITNNFFCLTFLRVDAVGISIELAETNLLIYKF